MNNYYLRLFFIVMAVFSASCTGQNIKYNIGEYRSIIGLSKSDLVNVYGESSVLDVEFSLHDPETTENGLKLLLGDAFLFLRTSRGQVSRVLFRSSEFKTKTGVHVGLSFCDVSAKYTDAKFFFEYSNGGNLSLVEESERIKFTFFTDELPFEEYILAGIPDKNSSTLCRANLNYIELFD
ncbi:hypothetical protein Maes01_02804 [Microbulbifer aestuariivivens]|uniref:Lipoprotein n=1 Tax=Microbulbifer aestuariivivens TaxID=1908308 RepID=A0ABP9WSM3_9GAMM